MFATQLNTFNAQKDRCQKLIDQLIANHKYLSGFRDLDGASFGSISVLDGTPYTANEAMLYAQRSAALFRSLRFDKNTPVPISLLETAIQSIQDMVLAGNLANAQIIIIRGEVRPYKMGMNGSVTVPATGEQVASLLEPCRALVASADKLSIGCSALSALMKNSALAKNNQEFAVISDDAVKTSTALITAERAARESEENLQRLKAIAIEIEGIKTSLSDVIAQGKEKVDSQLVALQQGIDRSSASSIQSTADAAVAASKLEDLNKITSQGEALYTRLTSFDATLVETQRRIVTIEESASRTLQDFTDQKDAVDKLVIEADAMVSGATSAGLAKAFADERDSLDGGMKSAFIGFSIGIGLLAAMTVILAAYVLQIPISIMGFHISGPKPGSAAFEVTIAGVISRSIILLAPFWLTLFSARRYRSLFDLRQQYSHKYNMAFSVDGFKKQAPKYADDITAWVFSIVAANPVVPRPGAGMDTPPSTSVKDILDGVGEQLGKVFKPTGA